MTNKIAIITPVFPPYGGGIGRVAADDARVLSSAGFDIEVFSPLKNLKPVFRFGNASFVPQLLWKIRKFDVAHLHYPFFGGAEIVWLAKKLGLFKGKIVITYHMDVVGSGWLGKIFAFHTKFIMPSIISSADKIIVTSIDYVKHSNIAEIIEKTAEKFVEIQIGVDDEFFHPAEKDAELLKKFNIADEKIILFVGGLDSAHYFKGLSYLLEAFKILVGDADLRPVRLIIVGSGNLKEEYEKMAERLGIKEKVIFAGSPSREDLPKFYNLADVFVLPSIDKSEAFGIVILEAMACGAPVVASELFGVRTLVSDNGFLAEPKNADNLAEKINSILENEDLRKQMGANSRKNIEEKYSYKKVGGKLIEIYKNKKICLINNLYVENARGGAETVVKTIADGLKEKGHEVFVISLGLAKGTFDSTVKGALCQRFVLKPLNICRYEYLSKHGMFFRLIWHIFDVFNLRGFFAIRKILKKEKPDIVWTHNLMGLGFLIPLAIKSLGINHIHTLHDVQLSVPSGLIIKNVGDEYIRPARWPYSWYEKICRALFGSPAVVISPSKWLLDFYVEKGFFPKSKKMIASNPVSHSELQRGMPPQGMRSFTAVQDDGVFNILFLGQIENHKGVIFAANALKKSSLNFIFHIVGNGEKLEEIKKITEGDVRFIIYGRKTGSDVEEIWRKIILTIVPSLCYENSPTVIFESLLRNIPVLASDIGGIPEIVPREFLFETGDENSFMEKIKWFLENREKLPEIKFTEINVGDYVDKILTL
jgi:glycosyltransferase involved in cell wall biosynthesis